MSAKKRKTVKTQQRIVFSSDSSDSDSNDEELARLKAAISGTSFVLGKSKDENEDRKERATHKKPSKPSLRTVEKFEERDNELHTTPEFRAHVAKKLSEKLESDIKVEISVQDKNEDSFIEEEPEKFKLFSTSVANQANNKKKENNKTSNRKHKLSSSSCSSEDDERFASVAVSADFIMSNSAIPCKSHPSIEDKNTNIVSCDGDTVKKKKKKKKEKRLKDQNGYNNKTDSDTNQCESKDRNMNSSWVKKHRKKHKKGKHAEVI